MASIQVIPPTYFSYNCKRIRERREKVLELVESQVQAIDNFYETFHNINEKTTRLVQSDVKSVCRIFDELIDSSATLKRMRRDWHPALEEIETELEKIKEQCVICRLPLAEGLPVDELKQKRWACLHAEERVTHSAHETPMIEDILIDNASEGFWDVMTTKFYGIRPIHEFYVALANIDTVKTRELVEDQRKFVRKVDCNEGKIIV